MINFQSKLVSTGLFFLSIFLSGFWLSRTGKPYNSAIFNIHKLIGLAMGVFLIVTVSRLHKATPLNMVEIIILMITVLIFISLVAAGGLLSADIADQLRNIGQPLRTSISAIHKIFPYLAVLFTAATLFLLLNRE